MTTTTTSPKVVKPISPKITDQPASHELTRVFREAEETIPERSRSEQTANPAIQQRPYAFD